MFCTSLRRRKTWAPAVPQLLQYEKMKFRENKIDTHDVNLPLPSSEPGQRYLRFALISSEDSDSTIKLQRVARIYHQSGGNDAAVVWLLERGGDTTSFAQFQIELVQNFNIPLIPLSKIEDLPITLLKFHRSFLQADAIARQRPVQNPAMSAVQSLLPYCALSPPLREHSVHVLSDLAVGFADLANKVHSDVGRAEISEYLGDDEAKRIIMFWMKEYQA